MEEEDLNEDQEVDTLYETFANLATDLSSQHNALAIAAVMNAVAMSIYKTAMSQEDFEKQLEFLIEVRNEVSRANQKIIDIRKIKSDMSFIKDKADNDVSLKTLIDEYLIDLSIIENNIHMTKNQSRQDPLNFGIRINNRIAFLLADSQRGDFAPTDQSMEFFKDVKKELDIEADSLKEVIQSHSQKIKDYIVANKIELISFEN